MKLIGGTEDLVANVTRAQRERRYTDQQMAEKFGCSRQTYQQTRTGKKKVGNAYFHGAMKFLSPVGEGIRSGVVKRDTGETHITVELSLEGTGDYRIDTGISMFDHMLSQVARHGRFDIKIEATGDDQHHVVEDVGICLGQAFSSALGDRRGIVRMSSATVPMDDALVEVAIDIGGRGYAVLDLPFSENDMFGFPTDLVRHFIESLANEAKLNLHARILYGSNDHHKAEAVFKALGRALDMATKSDQRIPAGLPSTKGLIES